MVHCTAVERDSAATLLVSGLLEQQARAPLAMQTCLEPAERGRGHLSLTALLPCCSLGFMNSKCAPCWLQRSRD